MPTKAKQNIIRAHSRKEWIITINELYILEMGSPTEPHTFPVPPTASFYTSTKKSTTSAKGKPRCPFCAGSHIPSLCESFKDPKQHCDIVHQNKLCFNCLGHHKVSSCNSRHRCHNCQRKYHTSICTNGQHNANPSEQPIHPTSSAQVAQPTNTPPGQATPQTNTPPGQATIAVNTTFLSMTISPSQNSVCLLKTAVATIANGDNRTRANLLFDEGSQRSFITQDLADALALQPYHTEDITVSSFGAQCQLNHEVNVAVINLLTLSGQAIPNCARGTSHCHTYTEYSDLQCYPPVTPPESHLSPPIDLRQGV